MRRFIGILLVSMVLFSCSEKQDNIVISQEFINQEWSRFEYLEGQYKLSKAPSIFDIIMEVTVTDEYPSRYETHQQEAPLSFNLTIKNPNSSGSRSKDFNFKLKDKDGIWRAEKKEGTYTFRLPIMSEVTLNENGIYNFKIENKYPKDPLCGIKSMTLMCIDSK